MCRWGWDVRSRGGWGSGDLVVFCDCCNIVDGFHCTFISIKRMFPRRLLPYVCGYLSTAQVERPQWHKYFAFAVCFIYYKKPGFIFPIFLPISVPTTRISRGRRLICRKHLANVPIRALIWKLHCAHPLLSLPLSLSLCLTSPRGCTSHCHNQHAVLVISLLITTSHRHTNSSINSIGNWGEYYNHWLLKWQQQRNTNIVHQLLIANKVKFLSPKKERAISV